MFSGQGPIRSRFEGCVDTLLIPATAGTEITTTVTATITAASAAAAAAAAALLLIVTTMSEVIATAAAAPAPATLPPPTITTTVQGSKVRVSTSTIPLLNLTKQAVMNLI